MNTVTVTLTRKQASELLSILWEICSETDDGIRYFRDDWPLSDVWRIIAEAYAPDKDYATDPQDCE